MTAFRTTAGSASGLMGALHLVFWLLAAAAAVTLVLAVFRPADRPGPSPERRAEVAGDAPSTV